jgi:hypothetical protein
MFSDNEKNELISEIKLAINNSIANNKFINSEIHHQHHEFIEEIKPFIISYIENEKIRRERWEELKRQLVGWSIIAIVGAIGAWFANHIYELIAAFNNINHQK